MEPRALNPLGLWGREWSFTCERVILPFSNDCQMSIWRAFILSHKGGGGGGVGERNNWMPIADWWGQRVVLLNFPFTEVKITHSWLAEHAISTFSWFLHLCQQQRVLWGSLEFDFVSIKQKNKNKRNNNNNNNKKQNKTKKKKHGN